MSIIVLNTEIKLTNHIEGLAAMYNKKRIYLFEYIYYYLLFYIINENLPTM